MLIYYDSLGHTVWVWKLCFVYIGTVSYGNWKSVKSKDILFQEQIFPGMVL